MSDLDSPFLSGHVFKNKSSQSERTSRGLASLLFISNLSGNCSGNQPALPLVPLHRFPNRNQTCLKVNQSLCKGKVSNDVSLLKCSTYIQSLNVLQKNLLNLHILYDCYLQKPRVSTKRN